MPKFSNLSGQDVIRALKRLGFTVLRQSGSHVIMRRGVSGCVAPNHKEVKAGTVSGVLRQAGVSSDEFVEALRG